MPDCGREEMCIRDRYDPEAEPEDELMLQGVVDCAFRTEQGLVIVDFKTDRILPQEEIGRASCRERV